MQSLIWYYFPWNIKVSITNFSLFSTHMTRFSNSISFTQPRRTFSCTSTCWNSTEHLKVSLRKLSSSILWFSNSHRISLKFSHRAYHMNLYYGYVYLTSWSGSSLIEELNSQPPLYSYNIQQSLGFEEREYNLKIHCFLLFRFTSILKILLILGIYIIYSLSVLLNNKWLKILASFCVHRIICL